MCVAGPATIYEPPDLGLSLAIYIASMWHYYLGLSGSNDVALGFTLLHDTVVRWAVTSLGKAFEMSANRWGRIGWFAPTDGPITGDPSLPDGRYYGKIEWMEHTQGLGL